MSTRRLGSPLAIGGAGDVRASAALALAAIAVGDRVDLSWRSCLGPTLEVVAEVERVDSELSADVPNGQRATVNLAVNRVAGHIRHTDGRRPA